MTAERREAVSPNRTGGAEAPANAPQQTMDLTPGPAVGGPTASRVAGRRRGPARCLRTLRGPPRSGIGRLARVPWPRQSTRPARGHQGVARRLGHVAGRGRTVPPGGQKAGPTASRRHRGGPRRRTRSRLRRRSRRPRPRHPAAASSVRRWAPSPVCTAYRSHVCRARRSTSPTSRTRCRSST